MPVDREYTAGSQVFRKVSVGLGFFIKILFKISVLLNAITDIISQPRPGQFPPANRCLSAAAKGSGDGLYGGKIPQRLFCPVEIVRNGR
jgi:hypothetical protein